MQDNSRFRGIGTVIRNIIEHIPNKNRYRVLIEKGRGTIESFGIEQLVFKSPLSTANYGQKLAEFLTEHHIDYCHFMAQYNIPDNFNFPYSVTVHDLFNDHLLTNQKKYQTTLAPMLKKLKKAKKLIAISQYTKKQYLGVDS